MEIENIQPARIEQITTAEELGDLLRATTAAAASTPTTVVPIGGGTSTVIGNHVERIDLGVDVTGISGIIEYSPADLTVSVRAGTRVAELSAELAAKGQELPIDVPLAASATIGGLIATAFAGPRRYGSGTLKDTLIGSSFVRGDGLFAKAGGMVVKNVSGFEVSRLLHGSWGTLAVIASANFKVTPIPKSDTTLSVLYGSVQDAISGFRGIVERGVTPSSAEIVVRGDDAMLALRILGRETGVADQVRTIADTVRADVSQVGAGEESREFWRRLGDDWATPPEEVQVAIGVRPRDVEATVTTLERAGIGASGAVVSPGTGTVRVRFPATAVAPSDFWSRMTPITSLPNGSATIEFAPTWWKSAVDVWGPRPDAIGVMLALKTQFDPAGILNRGRMII